MAAGAGLGRGALLLYAAAFALLATVPHAAATPHSGMHQRRLQQDLPIGLAETDLGALWLRKHAFD
jgi:hypothetical protein